MAAIASLMRSICTSGQGVLSESPVFSASTPMKLELPGGHTLRGPWELQLEELERYLARSRNLHPQTVNITPPSLTNDALAAIRAGQHL